MSHPTNIEPRNLAVRHFVYAHFVQHARPPSAAETAREFNMSAGQAEEIYQKLHRGHFLFLEPGSAHIRMANPFSARQSPFRVTTGRQTYAANCAWDMLGIPAMLGVDAQIEAECADCGGKITLAVKNGAVRHHNELIHFAVPFARWYDDLIFT
ncbi:MAG: hypothetical protein D6768_12805 [Chloroflexi bacterium]|nr:MAG: hypothetical protein D6768_12805 [Chloroflexota bacterium]